MGYRPYSGTESLLQERWSPQKSQVTGPACRSLGVCPLAAVNETALESDLQARSALLGPVCRHELYWFQRLAQGTYHPRGKQESAGCHNHITCATIPTNPCMQQRLNKCLLPNPSVFANRKQYRAATCSTQAWLPEAAGFGNCFVLPED